MQFEDINFHFQQSATLRLIRSDHAALALGFFDFAFKKRNRLQVPMSELSLALEQYIENLDAPVRSQYVQSATHYIDRWCDEKHQFLRRFYETDLDDPVVELSYETEQALELVWNLNRKEFVGTQSRFYNLFSGMQRLVEGADTNPKVRIGNLKKQKKLIDQEIRSIEETGTVVRFDQTQIREQFLNIFDDGRRLMADFRLVEDIFKEMAYEVKVKKLAENITKGEIVGQVLDSHEYLEQSDQGRSFDAFWNFLVNPEKQEQLKAMIGAILEIPEIKELLASGVHREKAQFLRRLKLNMLQVGQKALRSKTRLSEELRKLLHQSNLAENRQVTQEINAIKNLVLTNQARLDELGKQRGYFYNLRHLPKIELPLERPLWKSSEKSRLRAQQLEESHQTLDITTASALLGTEQYVDPLQLEENLASILAHRRSGFTLEELIARYPITKGITEVLGYFALAGEAANNHRIAKNEWIEISLATREAQIKLRTPQIHFYP